MFRSVNFRRTEDWGMFSTRSSVTQLRPETVLQCVHEAEETVWIQGDLNCFFPQDESNIPSLGAVLLSQSGSIKKIHNYFSQLESRKCCLHLTCRRATTNTIRVVMSSSSIDDGSGKKSHETSEVRSLENQELRAFKHAYLCAVYPVLAAPIPPSPASPSPYISNPAIASMPSTSSATHPVTYTSSHTSAPDKAATECRRPMTPYSLHDSGVEESEEAGLIPMESICEQLQRAFRLPRSMFRQYESMIIKTYAKKTSQKLLAEVLCGQLVVLERNNHPFYNPASFITQNGYDLWQKQERVHISSMLNKFWHSSLPIPADTQDLIAELYTIHDDYLILLKKLLSYESQFRQECGDRSSTSFSSLSTASCRLLLEFGLRYGIGELFQKIHHLECLSQEFNLSVGYLSFINHLLQTIQQTLPRNKSSVVMVRKELSVLQSSLRTLKVQTCKALGQMKSHFPNNKPVEGLELLLTLLRTVLSLMKYIAPSGVTIPKFDSCLRTTIQDAFHPTYEKFKMVAKNDLVETRETRVSPRLLNLLIQDIREDVSDYKNNFEGAFQKYFSISRMAAVSYYKCLIEDVKHISQAEVRHKPGLEIDLRMLALAFRLNQLEADWKPYIHDLKLTWRTLFLPSLNEWTSAMTAHVQDLVLEAVSCDKFSSRNIELSQALLRAYQVSCNSSDQYSRSLSVMSITPSINSAFSCINNNNSLRSSPHQSGNYCSVDESVGLIHESIVETGQDEAVVESDETPIDFSHDAIKRQPSFEYETQSLNLNADLKTSHFPAVRQYSLPAKLNLAASESEEDVFPFGNPENGSINHSPPGLDLTDGKRSQTVTPVAQTIDSPQMQMLSDDSDDDGEVKGDEDSPSSDDNNDSYKYPPLKLESQVSETLPDFTDFQSSSQSQQKDLPQMTTFILNTSAPPSLSSKAPSLAEHIDGSSQKLENDFSDSMDSNISFPTPTISQAMLPVSGSAVDLIVTLQRICNFGHNMITIMLPDDPNRRNSNDEKQPLSGYLDGTRKKYQEDSSFFSAPPSREESCTESMPIEVDNSVVSTLPTDKRDVRVEPESSDQDSSFFDRPNESEPQSSSLSQPSSSVEVEACQRTQDAYYALKLRLSLHLKLFKLSCNAVTIYTCNMLCMDLCGTSRNIAKHMVGPKLLEKAQSFQAAGFIWGCRHQLETDHGCLYYPNHRSRLLNGRYEAVTQNMCTRINNVYACLHFMEDFKDKLSKALNINEEKGDASFPSFGDENWKEFESLWQDFSPSVSCDIENTSADDQMKLPFVSAEECSALMKKWNSALCDAENTMRCHILAVLTAMCRLLAHKLNLFVRDGLPMLLYLKKENISMPVLLERITSFLQKYLDALSNWLYGECFRRTLDSLWVFMVQNFEIEAESIKANGTTASKDAHNWLLAIGHLIKFLNNNGKGIKKDLMLSQAENVIFRFQLFTLPTLHVIALFINLQEYYFEGDHLTLEELQLHSPPSILHRIHHDLQSLRKCFSGAELVHWIIQHKDCLPADLPITFGPDPMQSATTLCQLLLDQQFIVGIDFEHLDENSSPISISYVDGKSPYPQLSVHSHTFSPPMSNTYGGAFDSYPGIRPCGRMHSDGSDSCHTISDDVDYPDGSTNRRASSVISFHQATPAGEVTLKAEVHVSNENDNTAAEAKFSPIVYEDGEIVSIHDKSVQQERVAPAHRDENIQRLESPVPGIERPRKTHKDSVTSDDSCFRAIQNCTPFNSLVTLSPVDGHQFQPSSRRFYFIHQNALHTGFTQHDAVSAPIHKSKLSEADKNLLKIRHSKESHVLVEQCVINKVSSMTLLTILASRRKTDNTAKKFLNKLPSSLRSKVYKQLGAPVIDCRSS